MIPPFADVICDCRALPGQGEDEIRAHIAAALGDDLSYELELLEPLAGGTESPIETPLYRSARGVRGRAAARSAAAAADRHRVHRLALGAQAPSARSPTASRPVLARRPDAYLDAAHAADEAIEVDDLVEMAEFHLHAIRALSLASPGMDADEQIRVWWASADELDAIAELLGGLS